jgi:hypothetical protein
MTVTNKPVKIAGFVAMVAGLLMIIAGGVTWGMVSSQLKAEKITVAEDAARFAGKTVDGPLDAFYQADIIRTHTLTLTEGKTYAELDREDPLRTVAMNGSFLRASLFTSVVAFGVAAFAIGMGVLTALVGWALTSLATSKVSAPAPAPATV